MAPPPQYRTTWWAPDALDGADLASNSPLFGRLAEKKPHDVHFFQRKPQQHRLLKLQNTQLVGGIPTPLKNMSSSMGRMTSHILWKIKVMFETTNQKWGLEPTRMAKGGTNFRQRQFSSTRRVFKMSSRRMAIQHQ